MGHPIRSFNDIRQLALLVALTVLTAALPADADPTLTYSTYLGGSHSDWGSAVASWNSSTFIAGTTHSLDYPVVNVSSSKPGGDPYTTDVFVTALGPTGIPFYSTYVRMGDDNETVFGIGAGPEGSAYVGAVTYYGAEVSIIVAKLEPWGTLAWRRETYGRYSADGMTVDSQGNVYVTGRDNNEDQDYNYVDKAFAWKINADGTDGYWTEIDGNGLDLGEAIAVDASGNAYVTGETTSSNLPKANQQAPGGTNAFVAKIDASGTLAWSTYLGGSGTDRGEEIAVAADGSLVVAGVTGSADFPTLNALQTGLRGTWDLFVTRLRPWGARISSTYLGGSGNEELADLALEPSSILLAVSSVGADSPLRQPLDPSCGASFVSKLDAVASQVLDAACLGSSTVYGVAADASGISLTGAAGPDLPLENAWQPTPGGEGDAFAAKLTFNHPPDCSAASASPATLWPADGRFVSVSIRGVTDLEGDPVTLSLTSIYQDEGLTQPGTADASGLGTSKARLRASRLTWGDGRVYHLSFTGTDSHGDACTGLVKVCVPITQGGTCGDGGARVDSTQTW